ncbi:hypothetical protein PPERSA_04197 [Pseudocohnilembus persalinus]|uniref:Uncharacterized protein n=1 Tax=Pseudocohnilembus persalinus TaxID=266149 RepID=A0A0V0QN73_PSEPJ|nr:hypothetical protein PPERSA_04197 [Pseudocohnilembus persalinus]|eukprot:KRX03645.1 hypothetical protein PPERSA_04197 [Pseudocohnilembus persalinus]
MQLLQQKLSEEQSCSSSQLNNLMKKSRALTESLKSTPRSEFQNENEVEQNKNPNNNIDENIQEQYNQNLGEQKQQHVENSNNSKINNSKNLNTSSTNQNSYPQSSTQQSSPTNQEKRILLERQIDYNQKMQYLQENYFDKARLIEEQRNF